MSRGRANPPPVGGTWSRSPPEDFTVKGVQRIKPHQVTDPENDLLDRGLWYAVELKLVEMYSEDIYKCMQELHSRGYDRTWDEINWVAKHKPGIIWSYEDINDLCEIIADNGHDWKVLSTYFSRPEKDVISLYKSLRTDNRYPKAWGYEEHARFIKLAMKEKPINFGKVAALLNGRSERSCKRYYNNLAAMNERKMKFEAENAQKKMKPSSEETAKKIEVAPIWTKKEDDNLKVELLIRRHLAFEHGIRPDWSDIVKSGTFPYRTEHDLRQRFNYIMDFTGLKTVRYLYHLGREKARNSKE